MTQPSFTARVLVVAAIACLAWLTWGVLRAVAVPALWAALWAIMLWPLNVRMRRLLGGRCAATAAFLTVGSAIGVAGPAALTGVEFVQEASKLAKSLGSSLRDTPGSSGADWGDRVIRRIQRSLPPQLDIELESIRDRVIAVLGSGLEYMVSHLGNAFLGAIGAVSGIVVSLFILFYALRDGERMLGTAAAVIPLDPPRRQLLVDHLGAVTRALVVGTLATAAAQGALLSVAFVIVRLPAPVVFGVITAIVSVLPFGTGLVFVPAAIALAAMNRIVAAGFMMFWGLFVVSAVDNFIRPRIVSKRAKVPTLAVFLGIVGGIASFDLIGVFLGPLVLVTALEAVRLLVTDSQVVAGEAASIDHAAKTDDPRDR